MSTKAQAYSKLNQEHEPTIGKERPGYEAEGTEACRGYGDGVAIDDGKHHTGSSKPLRAIDVSGDIIGEPAARA